MKLLPFLLLFFLVQLNAQLSKVEKNITNGVWITYKVEDKYLGDSEISKIIFKNDNSYEISFLQNSDIVIGNWELSSNDKEFIIKRANEQNLKYEIILVNSRKIVLTKEGNLTIFKKIKADYTLPQKEYPKKLIGSWKIISRNGKTLDDEQFIKFNADGSSITNFTNNEANWWTRGSLLYINSVIEEVFEFSLSKNNMELSFVTGKRKMMLKKTDKAVVPLPKNPNEE